ncbi:MAG: hypothetical protein PHG85_04355, partial [Candidatus Altiarchaeota archaeon]|nr:hypothetical protein [Candidatus Altiarchaeota archaeon]
HSVELAEGESLPFPSTFVLTFNGYRTNDFQVSPCSGAGEGNIGITKMDFVAFLSFTGDDGQRYDDVRMDNGPFETGNLFILDGRLYEYDSYEQDMQTEVNQMKVVLKDVLNGGKNTYRLNAYYGEPDFETTTYAFEEAAENDVTELIEVDPEINDTDIFDGDIGDIYAMWIDGTLSFGEEPSGLDGGTFGTFDGFDEDGNKLEVSIVNEDGDLDMNGDGNSNDRLIVIKNEQGEYAVIDLYDRDYDSDDDSNRQYWETALSTYYWGDEGVLEGNVSALLNDEDDTILILPEGGDRITISYGSNEKIDAFSVCHPKDEVFGTAFIGTSEQETMLEAVITKDDEGKEQTVGCCTYTVKEFSVTVKDASQRVTETTMNPIVGGLVVAEDAADMAKNLIIVGGPAVNTLSSVTAAELSEEDDRFIVRKDGNKVIVAGYDAKDTVAAGNALIKWLQESVHA